MSCSVPQHLHKRIIGPRDLMGGLQFNTSTWVEVPGEISLIWLFVASSVRAISRAVSSVRVVSLSRSLVCVRLELDPKIRASMMCSSGFVNRHSSTRIRIFLTNESADSQVVASGSWVCILTTESCSLETKSFLNLIILWIPLIYTRGPEN